MRSEKRREYILQVAQKDGFVSISEAAEHLRVSIETVRRDINVLCGKNLLHKARGGAIPVKLPIRKDPEYLLRIRQNQHEKIAIGNEAAAMIHDGAVVTMDGGATTYAFASCIRGVHNVTFVLNSLPIANILLEKIESGEITGRIILIGGEVNIGNHSTQDAVAMSTIDKYHFDMAFVSCSSLSATGAANSSLSGVMVRKLMDKSSVSVLIADSEKLGKSSVYEFAKPTDFSHIITDNKHPMPADLKNVLTESDTHLTVVDCSQNI